jgi:hypothetical protein
MVNVQLPVVALVVALVMSEQYPVISHVPTSEPPHAAKGPHAAKLPAPPDEPSQESEESRTAKNRLRIVSPC